MDFLSIRITVQSVIALAEHIRRACPVRQPSEATLPKKSSLNQNAYRGFLPALRQNAEPYLPFLDIEDGIGRIALSKDSLLFGERCDCSTAVDSREERLRIEVAAFLDRCHGCHGSLPFNAKGRPRTPVFVRAAFYPWLALASDKICLAF
jgi:hypothetical protein